MHAVALRRLMAGVGFVLSSMVAGAHEVPPATGVPLAARTAIDPASGKLRPVEHDDGAGAEAPPASRSPVHNQGAPREIFSRTGVRGMTLDESFMSYTVVRRNADGTLDSACVHGELAARKLMQSVPVSRKVKAGGVYETE